jgi:hypothetical protein
VRALQRPPVGQLHGVLLDQQPLVAAVVEGLDEPIGHVGVVGQRHLRRGEAAHPTQRLQAKDGGEVVLPGAHMQPVILHRGGGGDSVPPRAAKPLHRVPQVEVAGQRSQGVKDVVQASAAQPVQQGAGVLQHDPRLLALAEQLGDELAHPLVAPVEHRSVMAVAGVGMF